MTIKQKIEKYLYLNQIIIILAFLFFKFFRTIRKRRKRSNGRIAAVSLHKLGDTVFTIPAIKDLIKFNPNKNIYIICFEDSKIIYQQIIKDVNYVILRKKDFYFNNRIASLTSIKKLRKLSPEIVLDLTGSITSASLIFSSDCKTISGINEQLFKGVYDEFHTIRKVPHQIDIYFDSLGTLIPPNKNKFSGYKLNLDNSSVVLIQPFAGWEAKEWGLSKFIVLYKMISKFNNSAIILPPGSIRADVISSLEEEEIKFIFTEDIESLINEIKNCKLFISNDSGPLQIAALLGKPTFSIYGPTNPLFHLPYGEYHWSIQKHLKCSPQKEKYCFTFGGRYCPHYDCMKLISVNEVFKSISKLLENINNLYTETQELETQNDNV